jgi:hypothetical protein
MLARVGMELAIYSDINEVFMPCKNLHKNTLQLIRHNTSLVKKLYPNINRARIQALTELTKQFSFSFASGDVIQLENGWFVTHTGLVRLARRKRCRGIHVEAVDSLCDSAANRFVLKATVYPSEDSAGFVGYGDADPSSVSLLVRGVEMRIAETRAVSRALPGLLSPFWFACLAWRPQTIGVLPHLGQGALEKELDLLIRRAVLPFREFCDPRFQAGSYSDKYGNSGFVHLQITNNFSC